MRALPFVAIALLASSPVFVAAPAPVTAKHVVLSTDADPRTLHDLLVREGYAVTVTPAATVTDTRSNEAIDYPSQLGPEGPRASR